MPRADQGGSLDYVEDSDDPMAELRQVYLEAVQQDVADLEGLIGKALADSAGWSEVCLEMRRITHNVKGQGSSFGYPLMTAVGNSLSILLKKTDTPEVDALKLAEAHVASLRLVLKQDIQGSGGDQGAELTKRLTALVEASGS